MIKYQNKEQQRQYFKNLKNTISPEDKNYLDKKIIDNLFTIKEFQNAKIVIAYLANNIEVNIDSNNKPNIEVIPNVLVKKPIIEEKIIYKVLNNKNSKENKNDSKVEVLDNKCEKTKCEVCRECNYKVYKLIIILLCLINLFLIGKNRYILTKGYK